jgi:hypothetical protein
MGGHDFYASFIYQTILTDVDTESCTFLIHTACGIAGIGNILYIIGERCLPFKAGDLATQLSNYMI